MSLRRSKWIRYSLSILVIAVAVYALSTLADLDRVVSTILRVDLGYLALATVSFYATFVPNGTRWRILLEEIDVEMSVPKSALFVFLGWFVNIIVPARAGDIYRCYLAESATGCSKSAVLGTIASERTIDLVVLSLGVTAGTVAFFAQVTQMRNQLLAVSVGVLLVVGAGVLTLLVVIPRLTGERFEFLDRFRSGFRWIRSGRSVGQVLGVTLVIWSLSAIRFWLVTIALGVALDPTTIIFVALLVSLLSGIPITPGGAGVVEVVSTSVLIGAAVPGSIGVSLILLDRLITIGSVIVVGTPIYLALQHSGKLT